MKNNHCKLGLYKTAFKFQWATYTQSYDLLYFRFEITRNNLTSPSAIQRDSNV